MNSKKLIKWSSILILVLASSFCVSYQTSQDLTDALARARTGEEEARQVVREIMENLAKMPAHLRMQAVETVVAIKGRHAWQALIKMAEHPALAPEEQERALMALIKRDEKGTPEALLEIVRRDPSRLKKPVMLYFGKKKFATAVPEIGRAIDDSKYIKTGIGVLKRINDKASIKYFMSVAARTGHPARLLALDLLRSSKEKKQRNWAVGQVKKIIQTRKKESEKAVIYAIGVAPELMTEKDSRFEVKKNLREIYSHNKKATIRRMALMALVRMEEYDAQLITRAIHKPLVKYQAGLSLWNINAQSVSRPEKKVSNVILPKKVKSRSVVHQRIDAPFKSAVEGPVRIKRRLPRRKVYLRRKSRERSWSRREKKSDKKIKSDEKRDQSLAVIKRQLKGWRRYPGTKRAYRNKIEKYLRESLEVEATRALMGRISSALKSYGESNSSSAKFLHRSYKREFGGNITKINGYLKKGIGKPGSLNAVIKNIYREYDNDPMRFYALSQLFGVTRWEAQIIFDFLRE